jgi:hypothetical protein
MLLARPGILTSKARAVHQRITSETPAAGSTNGVVHLTVAIPN